MRAPNAIEPEDTISERSRRITIVVGSSHNLAGRGDEPSGHRPPTIPISRFGRQAAADTPRAEHFARTRLHDGNAEGSVGDPQSPHRIGAVSGDLFGPSPAYRTRAP